MRPLGGSSGPITVDPDEVLKSPDSRLAPVRRYFELSARGGHSASMTLDENAIAALAALMNVPVVECRRILVAAQRFPRPLNNSLA